MSVLPEFQKAVRQVTDPAFSKVLLRAIGLTFALLVAVFVAFVWGLGLVLPETITLPFIGEVTLLTQVLSVAAMLLMFGLSVFLMVPVASIFVGFFLDDIVEAVERRHYPGLPPVESLPLSEVMLDSLRFLGLIVVANLVGLVFYLFSGPFAPFVFWLVNGFLLGREYFQLVAARRLGNERARALRKKHFGTVWTAGVLMAIPLSIPLVNLLIPVLGVATFTHIYHARAGNA